MPQGRPRFITLEGGEAVGKTTQLQLLTKRLQNRADTVMVLREPGGTPLGESIRHLLKFAPEGKDMTPEAELLLFQASRAELVRKVVGPSLDMGSWVLCDRFFDSTTVYQGAGRGLDPALVKMLNHFATSGLKPTLTIVLDLPVEIALQRLPSRGATDRMEELPAEFHSRVRSGYHLLAASEPERIRLIDASGSVESISDAIWNEVAHVFSL